MDRRKYVLYLEDEMDIACEIIEELEESGIKVIHCTDSTQGNLKVINQKFDLIIADIHLKKGTGDRVIANVKANPQHINFNTPVLVASSQITKELIDKIGGEISAAMVKPYDLDEFLGKVFKLLKMPPP